MKRRYTHKLVKIWNKSRMEEKLDLLAFQGWEILKVWLGGRRGGFFAELKRLKRSR